MYFILCIEIYNDLFVNLLFSHQSFQQVFNTLLINTSPEEPYDIVAVCVDKQ